MAFIKRPKFQSSLTVTTAKIWGYRASYPHVYLSIFKNDVVVKGVFTILNKLFSDKKTAVSFFIHQFLLNKANLAKQEFKKTLIYINRFGNEATREFPISNLARTFGLWTTKGERALMDPDFKLSSLIEAQKNENWLIWLRKLVQFTAVFDSDYTGFGDKGAFNLEKTTTNIYNLFVGWTVEEMKVQLKSGQGLRGTQGVQGLQGNKGEQGLGAQGDQGSRGPAGQNGQIKKAAVIGLSIGLGVFFCFFLAYVMVIYQKRIFSAFKNPKKSTKI